MGNPVTVTWGIVPDGTWISAEQTGSDLIAYLDGLYGGGTGTIAERPWFSLFDQSFGRWSELGGLEFVYEPHDDGATHGPSAGLLGVRPDVRIAGTFIDGNSGTLAYNTFPNGGDMVIDTGDSFFNNTTNNSRRLRNVVMHEAGHGFGLGHIESSDARFLMEPFISTAFDGPQFDDIRGIQHLYGDALEKAHGGAGNDIPAHATDLDPITDGMTRQVGADTGFGTVVSPVATDFVSLANSQDVDFYSFSIDAPSLVDITLTPVGATFLQGSAGNESTFVTSAISNLTLALFDSNGTTPLEIANNQPAGAAESILRFPLEMAGEYFVRVTGDTNTVQFYELQVAVEAAAVQDPLLAGDYNEDGVVDAADFTVWRDTLGLTGTGLLADGNGDRVVDQLDYDFWKANFGATAPANGSLTTAAVPEPQAWVLGWMALAALLPRRAVRS